MQHRVCCGHTSLGTFVPADVIVRAYGSTWPPVLCSLPRLSFSTRLLPRRACPHCALPRRESSRPDSVPCGHPLNVRHAAPALLPCGRSGASSSRLALLWRPRAAVAPGRRVRHDSVRKAQGGHVDLLGTRHHRDMVPGGWGQNELLPRVRARCEGSLGPRGGPDGSNGAP